jgi:putative molybdopterin biosynthesis protein
VTRFLTLTPYKKALEILQELAELPYQKGRVQVTKSLGNITYQPVYAKLTVPQTAISLRDGYAVSSADTEQARDSQPVVLSDYAFVHTGSKIPQGYDAVIMQEDVMIEPEEVLIIKPARSGQNIQKAGSETSLGKMIIPADHLISATDIGAMISYGITMVEIKKFIATLIPVGDELKEPCTAPGPGEVIASNTVMLQAYLERLHITPILHPIIPDSPEKIKIAVQQAVLDSSFIIVSGGTSVGKRDCTKSALSEIGTILYHGVAMRPGRTTLAARVDNVMVFGLPGSPVGSWIPGIVTINSM